MMLCIFSGCSSIQYAVDGLNKSVEEKAATDRDRSFNDQMACRISFDDLHVYGDMKKSDIVARLYSDLALTPRNSKPPKTNQIEIYDVAKVKDDYQIELGQIWFVNGKVWQAVKNFKTFKDKDSTRAIRFFFDLVSKTAVEFGDDASTKIIREGEPDTEYRIFIRFHRPSHNFYKDIVFEISRNGTYFYVKEYLRPWVYGN